MTIVALVWLASGPTILGVMYVRYLWTDRDRRRLIKATQRHEREQIQALEELVAYSDRYWKGAA